MLDIQQMLNVMGDMARKDRAKYHLTLGGLEERLAATPGATPVRFDHGAGVGPEDSYRGYYEDLAFESGGESIAADLLGCVRSAIGSTYTGYKGGEFTMRADTPLWNAPYGCCGLAITGADMRDGVLVLTTKALDS